MKIAVLATLTKSVSSQSKGGTEAFSYILSEALIKKGIDTTLFATSDSSTNAKLESFISSMYEDGIFEGPANIVIGYESMQARNLILKQKDFDIIHNNYWYYYLFTSFSEFAEIPIVTTIHNNYWYYPNLRKLLEGTVRKGKDKVVFASHLAKNIAGDSIDSEVIYHGINIEQFPYNKDNSDYVLWLGRLVPEKGYVDAIQAANLGNFKLILDGTPSTKEDHKLYFEQQARPFLSEKIEFLDNKGSNKVEMYQNAKAFLFPTHMDEQFGYVAAEAMACGTPVIAYNRGAIPEVVEDGITGFVVDEDNENRPGRGSWIIKKQGIEGIVEAVGRIGEINRELCRKRVEDKFTSEKMIEQYLNLYSRLLNK